MLKIKDNKDNVDLKELEKWLNILYDLIGADLVEKVDDNNGK